jgi:hypothetical protein
LPAGCSGTLTGPLPGPFTCASAANYYYQGGSLTEGRQSSLITVLNNTVDPGHIRPAGVMNCGANVELEGEPMPGMYGAAAVGQSGTSAHVNYVDGRRFNTIKSLALVLTEVTFVGQFDGATPSRIYQVKGSLDATLTEAGATAEVELHATF